MPDENIVEVPTSPFDDQKPGTSGLRKKTKAFTRPHYLENFVQSVLNVLETREPEGRLTVPLVIGGDGRFYNREAIQIITRIAVANGYKQIMVARDGLLSTPAASAVVRANQAIGAFILSASHNPGGEDADFGIKFNTANGGPAPQSFTDAVFAESKNIYSYRILKELDLDLSKEGLLQENGAEINVFNPLSDYVDLLQSLFDFDLLAKLFSRGYRVKYDAMHAVTGPYAKYILEDLLKAPEDTVIRGIPLEDFGGLHPDPNQKHARQLVELMNGSDTPDFGAASDGDGDRNLILGPNLFVTPGDSLAIIVEHAAQAIPGYRAGIKGVARSMPTSSAVDRVAQELGVRCYETPTGWKFFCNLMDAGKVNICGEESFGTGSDHVREKDGLWAVLCWLSIIAQTGLSVTTLVHNHWKRFGRSYYQRHDYEGLASAEVGKIYDEVRNMLREMTGNPFAGQPVALAHEFAYSDTVSGEVIEQQGLRIVLADKSRVIFRLSGTGTEGATLRIYLERIAPEKVNEDVSAYLIPLAKAAQDLFKLKERLGVDAPTVIT